MARVNRCPEILAARGFFDSGPILEYRGFDGTLDRWSVPFASIYWYKSAQAAEDPEQRLRETNKTNRMYICTRVAQSPGLSKNETR